MRAPFDDRTHGGRVLADRLGHLAGRDDVVVLALPRGGVPVAREVADRLRAPLDVFVVRKLGVPGQEELAMGATATGGAVHLNATVIDALDVPDAAIRRVTDVQRAEVVADLAANWFTAHLDGGDAIGDMRRTQS